MSDSLAGEALRSPDETDQKRAAAIDRTSVPAALLAALGEAGVVFLLVDDVALDTVHATGGPLASYPLFAALFVAGVGLATAYRRLRITTTVVAVVAAVVGAVQAVAFAAGDPFGRVASVMLALVVGLRVVSVSARDWRQPVSYSFGFGAGVLLAELILGGWRVPPGTLPVITIAFFVGALGSRAASVRMANRSLLEAHGGGQSRSQFRTLVVSVGALVASLGLVTVLALPNGVLQVVGGVLGWVVLHVILGIGYVIARVLSGPLGWTVRKLHLSFEPFTRLAQTLQGFADSARGRGTKTSGTPWVQRVLGLLFVGGLVLLLVRAIRRRFELVERSDPREDPTPPEPEGSLPRPRRRRRGPRTRRELPADTVRRWYAEILLVLERKGLAKEPSITPGEFESVVGRAFPECGPGFDAITRAYEDVRYGSVTIGPDGLASLGERHRAIMDVLRHADRVGENDEEAPAAAK
jgi:hypothetical protein